MTIRELYNELFNHYGPQGWWPVHTGRHRPRTDAQSGLERRGYHPGDYSVPTQDPERYEICVGAILTQNTAWMNVEKALFRLIEARTMVPERIVAMGLEALAELIRPAGYFNVKSRKLLTFSKFYLALDGRLPSRDELLGVWGIGPETADSILLYAYGVPTMVVDSYTKRIFTGLGLADADASYDELKQLCETALPPDVAVYQEFHALLVARGKDLRKPVMRSR